jgi:hypothetical protein
VGHWIVWAKATGTTSPPNENTHSSTKIAVAQSDRRGAEAVLTAIFPCLCSILLTSKRETERVAATAQPQFKEERTNEQIEDL